MASDESLCQQASLSGYTMDGTFQQYALANSAHAARIPKEVPLDAISPILCAGITVYKALKESQAKSGQTVVITGAGGGLGTLALQYAKAMGFRTIAIDTGDEKEQVAKKLGAEVFVDFAKDDVIAKVKESTGGLGAHAVILLAVSEKPFQQATEVSSIDSAYFIFRPLTFFFCSTVAAVELSCVSVSRPTPRSRPRSSPWWCAC